MILRKIVNVNHARIWQTSLYPRNFRDRREEESLRDPLSSVFWVYCALKKLQKGIFFSYIQKQVGKTWVIWSYIYNKNISCSFLKQSPVTAYPVLIYTVKLIGLMLKLLPNLYQNICIFSLQNCLWNIFQQFSGDCVQKWEHGALIEKMDPALITLSCCCYSRIMLVLWQNKE